MIKIANGILLYVKQGSPSVDENTHIYTCMDTRIHTHTYELSFRFTGVVFRLTTTQQPQTDEKNNPGISDIRTTLSENISSTNTNVQIFIRYGFYSKTPSTFGRSHALSERSPSHSGSVGWSSLMEEEGVNL